MRGGWQERGKRRICCAIVKLLSNGLIRCYLRCAKRIVNLPSNFTRTLHIAQIVSIIQTRRELVVVIHIEATLRVRGRVLTLGNHRRLLLMMLLMLLLLLLRMVLLLLVLLLVVLLMLLLLVLLVLQTVVAVMQVMNVMRMRYEHLTGGICRAREAYRYIFIAYRKLQIYL